MSTNKMIGLLWVGGWLIIGLPYSIFKQIPLSEMLMTFIQVTIFFGILFALGEIRSYIKKRANQK